MLRKTLSETMDIYNTPVTNGKEMDTNGIDRIADVRERKLSLFMAKFDPGCKFQDVKSKKLILKDRQSFKTRYLTTFRESGTRLTARVNSRILFVDPKNTSTAFALDYETHTNLMTPSGQMLDGSTGLNGPRNLDLAVLYHVRNDRICNVWLSPDKSGVGKHPKMSLSEIQNTEEYRSFAGVLKEHRFDSVTPRQMFTTRFVCGHHEMKGRRQTMEDKSIHCSLPDGSGREAHFVGVYDGHGGKEAAEFVGEKLHVNLQAALPKTWDYQAALYEAFLTTDEQLIATDEPSGTCAVVAVLHESVLYLAHTGDCRAVLCSGDDWRATRLTEDHKPDREDERARIISRGGEVVEAGCWRVTSRHLNVMMATSRAIGDRAFKTGKHAEGHLISSEPETSRRNLSSDDRFLITACDGVWDVLSDQEACDVVSDQLKVDPHTSADALSRQLVEAAYSKGSGDNISAAVSLCRF